MAILDWSRYPDFSEDELRCKHTGRCEMAPTFMERLQHVRDLYGKPMNVTSGYRDPSHPVEARKATTGEHTTGHAVDIGVRGKDALDLVRVALSCGFTRVGVQQKGEGRFIHLGDDPDFPPGIWSY